MLEGLRTAVSRVTEEKVIYIEVKNQNNLKSPNFCSPPILRKRNSLEAYRFECQLLLIQYQFDHYIYIMNDAELGETENSTLL